MLTAQMSRPQSFSLVEVAMPKPAAEEVRIRVAGCGVCASSLPLWEGRPWFSYPAALGAPGHEAWGYVDTCGSKVVDFRAGDSVTVLSVNAFAEYVIAPAAHVANVPRHIFGYPFPGEAIACAMNVWDRSKIEARQNICIVGTGFLGMILVQLAHQAGARVIAVSRRAEALSRAKSFGADHGISFQDNSAQKIFEITGGTGCDCVIETAGVQRSLDLASSVVAERGHLVIAGYHQDGHRTVDLGQWNWRGIQVTNAHERDLRVMRKCLARAAALVDQSIIQLHPLLDYQFGLTEINHAFETMQARPSDFFKSSVIMEKR